jgi:hypothetical protein
MCVTWEVTVSWTTASDLQLIDELDRLSQVAPEVPSGGPQPVEPGNSETTGQGIT